MCASDWGINLLKATAYLLLPNGQLHFLYVPQGGQVGNGSCVDWGINLLKATAYLLLPNGQLHFLYVPQGGQVGNGSCVAAAQVNHNYISGCHAR